MLHEVKPTELEYAQRELLAAVARDDQSKWEVGDAALHILRAAGSDSAAQEEVLREFVEAEVEGQYGLSFVIIRGYAVVFGVWPPDLRVKAPWAVHKALIAPESRHLLRDGLTIQEANEARVSASRERLRERVRGQELPARAYDDPIHSGPQEPKKPSEYKATKAELKWERTRLSHKFTRSFEDLADIAENLIVAIDTDWAPDWLQQVEDMRVLLDEIERVLGDALTQQDS